MDTDIVQNATVENVVRLTLHNRDTYRGEYDSGDDWEIESFGKDLEDAMINMIPEYINSGIDCNGHDIDVVTRIKWNKDYWYNDKHEHSLHEKGTKRPVKSYQDVCKFIENHPEYKRIVEENRIADEERKRVEKLEQQKENRRINRLAKEQTKKDEIAKLKELAKKYPNEIK